MPQYASEIDNTSCAATLNKYIQHLDFITHIFRHTFIDRLKGCGDVPVPVAEAISGHGRNGFRICKVWFGGLYAGAEKGGD